MPKDLKISFLLDFYGELLTDKQREAIENYYNQDLSLSEIALNQGISRQGVRDAIKRAESLLLDMEQHLGLAKKFLKVQAGLETILEQTLNIEDINYKMALSNDILKFTGIIKQTIKELSD